MAKSTSAEGLADYRPAFADPTRPFVTYYSIGDDKKLSGKTLTRGEFWTLGKQAATVLTKHNIAHGDCFAHYFTDNRLEDIAFRLASPMIGATPVTINWQADTIERIIYKVELTRAKLMLVDSGVDKDVLAQVVAGVKGWTLQVYEVANLSSETPLEEDKFGETEVDQPRIIIFTSGTTGNPKGVELPYTSYRCNRGTFEKFLELEEQQDLFCPIIINPLHHTNSTAFTDMAMRRPHTHLHLVQRYNTNYWALLAELGTSFPQGRLVAPAVSRHFDFLANLIETNTLPCTLESLQAVLARLDFLIGSAPVGPTTVNRLQKYAGKLPLVRFGSTETCLQVLGTPRHHSDEQRLSIFKLGWSHTYQDIPQPGYFIGRPHPPYNQVQVVKSCDKDSPDYFKECAPGEPGQVITKGGCVMRGYVGNEAATAKALHDGWYTNLGDVGFYLVNGWEPTEKDFYWQSRDSALLIRGGANYAYEQINGELKKFIETRYKLIASDFDLAVVGVKVQSEHEDDCCVCLELKTEAALAVKADVEATFLSEAAKSVSKGAKPNHILFAPVPKNFKGAVLVKELKPMFEKALQK